MAIQGEPRDVRIRKVNDKKRKKDKKEGRGGA